MTTSFTLEELAKLVEGRLVGDPSHKITGVESLELAKPHQASFLENPRYEQTMRSSQAGVIIVPPHITFDEKKNYLICEQPSIAFQKVIELFLKAAPSGFSSIHPTAVIHETAKIGANVTIAPYAVIDRDVVIGDNCSIGVGCFIGPEVVIGNGCHCAARSLIHERTIIGDRVILQSGCVIGSSGFGFAQDKNGNNISLAQLGIVIIEDDVEIGSNTTIDRARFGITRIGRGTKIDNLVQIAHQVSIGENNLIVAQVGIAGSTKTGKNVVLAGQVGVVGHITLGDNVILAARAAATKSILKGGVYSGAPALPVKECNEQVVYIKNLKKMTKRLADLEEKINKE